MQNYNWPPIVATTSTPFAAPNGGPIPAQSALIAGNDGGLLRPVLVDNLGQLQVEVTGSVLPAGAATEATLLQVDADIVAGNAILTSIDAQAALLATEATLLTVKSDTAAMVLSLSSIDTKLTAPISVTGPLTDVQLRATPVPVSASSLPLPTGAATEATLLSVDSGIALLATEVTAAAILVDTTSIDGKLNSLGQKAMVGSVPVVIASDQSALPVAPSASPGRSVITTVRNDYVGTPVTSGAWLQLIASTASTVNMIEIFDSSGSTMELGLGAAASEVRLILVFPGGNGQVPVSIPSGSRLSVRAVSATANAGELDINLYS